ncbi:MAG: hypothetical protein L6R38_005251 [Xanthoria sp. 2 TBL-2021]|nr:MAG: hypothetical protein L6R38_005251 [Xanthoria sp. 2 TBL-2021]
MVAEYIRSMTEVRVATEFRDYIAWAHQELQTDDIQSVLWTHPPPPTPNLDWQVFEEQLAQDEEKLRIHRLITRGSQPPDNYEKPHVPWFSEFATAVEILGTDDEDIRNQIKAYAQGKSMCHEGIYQLVYECDLDGLAQRLARETANLEWFFRDRDDPQEEISMRYILERIQSKFFTRCFLQENKGVYSFMEESERQKMALFGGQSAGYEDYSNY